MTLRILLAEHDANVGRLLGMQVTDMRDQLSRPGETTLLSSVTEVTAALRDTDPGFDLVITDWVWPSDADPAGGERFSSGAHIAERAIKAGARVIVITRKHDAFLEAQANVHVSVVLHWSSLTSDPTVLASNTSTLFQNLGGSTLSEAFIVYGHDEAKLKGLKKFLRDIGVRPLDFSAVKKATAADMAGGDRPMSTFDVITRGTGSVDCVLVLATPDESVTSVADPTATAELRPRPNVIFEAGLAFAKKPGRTAIVKVGDVSNWSDLDGVQYLRFPITHEDKKGLIDWLRSVGVDVDDADEDVWRDTDYSGHTPGGTS